MLQDLVESLLAHPATLLSPSIALSVHSMGLRNLQNLCTSAFILDKGYMYSMYGMYSMYM